MGFMIDEDIKDTGIVENKTIKKRVNIFANIKNSQKDFYIEMLLQK